ncbi:MAG: NAD(P)H-hydrate dehydratase [Oscillospiraceae bacterium]|jgi:NAD(P)H-hydrate epimerase|nr:NAD(P)H-hydrate dehydratase [Oscillospiraceae bacterium]
MQLITAEQARSFDSCLINDLRIPSAALMRRASAAVAAVCLDKLDELFEGTGAARLRVLALCGAGNNGGDGFGTAAEILRQSVTRGYELETAALAVGDLRRQTAEAREMAETFALFGGRTYSAAERTGDAEELIARADIIIDAVFGVGLSRPVDADAARIFGLVNSSGAFVVACDIPSGVASDTGKVLGAAIRADVTVTFTRPKLGCYLSPGAALCGRIIAAPIAPEPLAERFFSGGRTAYVNARPVIARRARDSHKGEHGRVSIIAGSVGLSGAAIFAMRAASAAGAGLVYAYVPEGLYGIVAAAADGEIVAPYAEIDCARIFERSDAVLVGPGLGLSDGAKNIVAELLRLSREAENPPPLILDADALTIAAESPDMLCGTKNVVLTPHDGEFARLVNADPNNTGYDFPDGRLAAASGFVGKYGVAVVLKGFRTLICAPEESAAVNTTGSPAMAKGGSGDVLAGMLAGLSAQARRGGLPLSGEVNAAVYLHGLAGERAAAERGEYSVSPLHIIDCISKAILLCTEDVDDTVSENTGSKADCGYLRYRGGGVSFFLPGAGECK